MNRPRVFLSPRQKFILLAFAALTAAVASICLGSTSLSVAEAIAAIRMGEDNIDYRVLMYIRFPRMLGGTLAGSALAVSGAILQVTLNNSLAGPNVIGINSGAGFAALLSMVIFPYSPQSIAAMSFIGALLCTLLIYAIGYILGASRATVILTGVAVSSIINAFSSCLKTLYPDIAASYTSFSIGTLANITSSELKLPAIYIIVGLIVACIMSRDMNLLALGDEIAMSLGLNVQIKRLLFLGIAALLAGSAVSFCGLISFVGLMIPHIARTLFGNDNRFVIPASGLLGIILVLISDILGRVLFAPFELPAGVILAIVGGIYFMSIIIFRRRGRLYA